MGKSSTDLLLEQIIAKLDKLENRMNTYETKDIKEKLSDNTDNKPVFHSLPSLEEKKAEEQELRREKIEPLLDETADKVIAYFSKHPPIENKI